MEIDVEALRKAVENDQSLTTKMLAEQFGVDHSTIVRRLKALGKGSSRYYVINFLMVYSPFPAFVLNKNLCYCG